MESPPCVKEGGSRSETGGLSAEKSVVAQKVRKYIVRS